MIRCFIRICRLCTASTALRVILTLMVGSGTVLAQNPGLDLSGRASTLAGSPTPGGVAVVEIDVGELGQPVARFGNRDLLVIYRKGGWYALVGLPSSIIPGNYVVNTYSDRGDTGSKEFAILARAPQLPALQGRQFNGSKQTSQPNDTTPVRWQIPGTRHIDSGELIRINKAIRPLDTSNLTTYSTAAPNLDLSPVTESLGHIPYGALVDNSSLRRHDYISYQTRPGAQVYAPADGKVRAIISDSEGLKILYLDHGKGLISVIGNLLEPLVVVDQLIQRGEQLATAGAGLIENSGSVDWGLQMNGWLVDPSVVARLGLSLRADEIAAPSQSD